MADGGQRPRPGGGGPTNWGRFGDDDELGTLNFLTPTAVLAAASCIRTGEYFPLNLPLDQPAGIGFGRPDYQRVQHARNIDVLGMTVNDDWVTIALQGSSQWDGLIHAGLEEPGHDGVFYNGVGTDAVDESGFVHKNSIDKVAQRGIVGRGVLLDIARFVAGGADTPLPLTFLIEEDLVRECSDRQGVAIRQGDVVCLRTGWTEAYLRATEAGKAELMAPVDDLGHTACPGISAGLATLAHEQGWAAVTADNLGMDATPPRGGWAASAHVTMMRNLGLTFGELFWYQRLAEACQRDGRWDFLFVAVPLWVPGGSGSPSCAIAIR